MPRICHADVRRGKRALGAGGIATRGMHSAIGRRLARSGSRAPRCALGYARRPVSSEVVMPVGHVENPVAIDRIASNAAALGLTPAQLAKLLEGVELQGPTGGFLGFGAKQPPDIKDLMGGAAEELARRLKNPQKEPAPPKEKAPEPLSLEQKVADAARRNAEAAKLADAAKTELKEKLPAFMESAAVKTLARGIGEMLNAPDPNQPLEKQKALSLLSIDLPKSGTDDALQMTLYATRNGIRVIDTTNRYYSSDPKTASIKPERLGAILSRAGMSLLDLESAVQKASEQLAAGKASGTQVSVNRADQLLQKPFDTTFDLEAEKKKIAAGTPHTVGTPWPEYSQQARERASFALAYLDTIAPPNVQPAEFRDAAGALMRALSNAKASAGGRDVMQLFVQDTLAVFDKINALAHKHGLTKGDMSDANLAILFYSPMTSYDAKEPDGVNRSGAYRNELERMHSYYKSGIGIYER
jgi:hypothetical protein